jgi:hypothetical protein
VSEEKDWNHGCTQMNTDLGKSEKRLEMGDDQKSLKKNKK